MQELILSISDESVNRVGDRPTALFHALFQPNFLWIWNFKKF